MLPAQRLALPAVALQETLERGGEGGGGQAGDPADDRAARALGQRHGPVGQRVLRVGRDVLPRDLGQQARRHAEERADLVQGLRGLVDQPPVAKDQDLLAGEQGEQVLELLAVAAKPGVVPEAGPARGDPALLLIAGPDEIGDRLQARRPQVSPVGMGAFDWVADDHDQPGRRDRVADPAHRGPVVQVERRRLAPQRPGGSRGEQGLVVRPPPDVLPVGQRVPRAALGRGRPVGQEELGLLDGRHVERGVFGQRGVQGGGTGLGGADDQEVGHRHGGLQRRFCIYNLD